MITVNDRDRGGVTQRSRVTQEGCRMGFLEVRGAQTAFSLATQADETAVYYFLVKPCAAKDDMVIFPFWRSRKTRVAKQNFDHLRTPGLNDGRARCSS